MIPEFDDIKDRIVTTCSSPNMEGERQRILIELTRCEIKQLYRDLMALKGKGHSEEIKRFLSRHFNKSYKTIERYIYS